MAAFQGGYLTIGNYHGTPVKVHWSIIPGALFFGHLRFVPGFWLGFAALVLFHELGHAFVVRQVHAKVSLVEAHGLGGLCWWEGKVTPIQRACIAWGGIWAQMVCWTLADTLIHWFPPADDFTAQLAWVFTTTNVWMMLINLIPVRPLDGAEAWKLFPLLLNARRRAREQEMKKMIADSRKQLARSDRLGEEAPPEVVAVVDEILKSAKGSASKEK